LKPSSAAKHDTSATNPVTAYALRVRSGAIVAGHAVRQACERHLIDLEHGPARGLRFSRAAVDRVLKFFGALRLAEGGHAGQPFTLLPWQVFVVGSLFGWIGPDGYRRFRSGFIETGKGSGKTPTFSGGSGSTASLRTVRPGARSCSAPARASRRTSAWTTRAR
jgi:phage terminase large subunit-like protein